MIKSQDIPSHTYNEAAGSIQQTRGMSSLGPQFPVVMTRFELMNMSAQADYPHSHDWYEVLYVCEGEGSHIIDFDPYPVKAPMFYFLSKGQIHFWHLKKPLKGHALLFQEEFLGVPSSNIIRAHDFSFFHQVGPAPHLSVDKEQHLKFSGLLEDMEQEFNNKHDRSITVLRSYAHILFTKLHRLYVAGHPDEHPVATSSLVRQFEQLVSERFIAEHSVQGYAKRMGVSDSHLRDTVKAVTGESPGNIIRNKLILEAKRLLAHSDATSAEISYRLNFEDASYFGRFFKRETGMSPSVFRRQIREQYHLALG